MTGTFGLKGELELEETTDSDGNKAWQVVDENGNRRKLILGELEADVSNVKELSLTDSSPVTGGPVGDEGEWIPLQQLQISDRKHSVTSTSYTEVSYTSERAFLDFDYLTSLTNVTSLGASLHTSILRNDTSGETTYARFQIDYESAAEVTVTGTGYSGVVSQIDNLGVPSGQAGSTVEMKVTAGTGEMFGVQMQIWGLIG